MDKQPFGMNAGEKAAGRIFGMIGLARRAGRLTFGFDAVLEDIAAGRAKAVLVSYDASERTVRKMKEACARRQTRLAVLPLSKSECGGAAGRPDTAVLAVSDGAFAGKLLELAGADISAANPASLACPEKTTEEIPFERTDTGGGPK
jgi:Ribosomal protein HS6-type (S12/L30/L7a)